MFSLKTGDIMNILVRRGSASLLAMCAVLACGQTAFAQSRVITGTNVSTTAGSVNATLNGTVFVNQGLMGAGRLDANTRDFRGETLGSFSGMAIDLNTWRRNADGSYQGSIFTLPDRGPFDGAIDYRNRVHTSNITFRPLAANSAALPQSAASQSQLTITPTGGFTLKDTLGVEMTGRDPGANTVTRNGIIYPQATDGSAGGRISLDAEAIAFLPNGNFYVSDEYAAGIYYFDSTGKQIGAIQTVPALLPRTGTAIDFNSVNPGAAGRRNNQGLEAMAITPDSKRLVTILQSATVQDTNGANQQTRNNTRILVYDISGNATPTNPIGHYVLQLPIFNQNGTGNPNRTAAQSEMLALNDTQFLVLSRDGIGRGIAADGSTSQTPVFKSVLLVDTAGATNLAGTQYETGIAPIATNGTLNAGIVPVQQVELVNLLNSTQLARVGMNLGRLPTTNPTSLGEKWEALALAPVLEEGAPQDFFLFVGNDNDFQGTNISFNGNSYVSGALDGSGNNDSILLVYRLTLPTYVDPTALRALSATAPNILYGTRMTMNALGLSATAPAMTFLNAQRGWSIPEGGRRPQIWFDAGWSKIGAGASPLTKLNVDMESLTLGVDVPLGAMFRIGGFGGYRSIDGRLTQGAPIEGNAFVVGGYAAVETPMGVYAEGSVAWIADVKLDKIARGSAYSQDAMGRTKGDGYTLSGEIGWSVPVGGFSLTPFAAVDYVNMTIDAYTETGASVSNLAFPRRRFNKLTTSIGGEIAAQWGAVRPAIRGGYSFEDENRDRSATVRLASAQHSMGTVVLPLERTERDSAFGELRIGLREGHWSGYIAGKGRWGRGDDDARVNLGIAYAF